MALRHPLHPLVIGGFMNAYYIWTIVSFMISLFFMAGAVSKHLVPYAVIPIIAVSIIFLLLGYYHHT